MENKTSNDVGPRKKPGGFFLNALTLASGNIISQAIRISLIPIVTRLYPPESFGLFSTIIAIVMVVSAVSHLRYNVAIQLPKDDGDADSVTLLGFLLVLVISCILLATVSMWADSLAPSLHIQGPVLVFYFIPIGIFLRGMLMIVNSWHLRCKAFKKMAGSLVFGAIGDRAVTLGIGLQGIVGPMGLILGRFVGILLTVLGMLCRKSQRHFFTIFSANNLRKIREIGLRFKEFPKYAWSELILQLTVHMPVILLGLFFNPIVVGYFALTRRVLMEPIVLVGEAMSRSFFQKASEFHREGKDISGVSVRLLHYLCVLVIFPMLLFGIFAQEVFAFAFGQQWQEAGAYTQILIPLFVVDFIVRPLNSIFDILIKQKECLFFNLAFFVGVFLSFVALGSLMNPLFCIGFYALVSTVILLHRLFWLLSSVGVKYNETAKEILSHVFRAILFAGPVLIAKLYFENSMLTIAISLSSIFVYFGYCVFAEGYFGMRFRYTKKGKFI